jgi:hypothetical protein
VVIDDFHVHDNDTRGQFADLLKRLADTESERSKLIIVGINRAGDSLIDHAPDLANRLDTIRFEVEPDHKVEELITAGEQALSIDIDAKARIVEGSQGKLLPRATPMPCPLHRGRAHRGTRHPHHAARPLQHREAECHGAPRAAVW